jgi:hypothetical protein
MGISYPDDLGEKNVLFVLLSASTCESDKSVMAAVRKTVDVFIMIVSFYKNLPYPILVAP